MKPALTICAIATLTLSPTVFSASYSGCSDKECTVRSNTTSSTDYAATQYPIVLAHGLLGYDKIAGTSYWYGIPEDLAANGSNVYVTQVSPYNSTYVRGEQLLKQVQTILAISGAQKVNLIGHSQGGFSVRYVLGIAPELVASVSTIGSPHKGTKTADFNLSLLKVPVVSSIQRTISNAVGSLVNLMSGNTSKTGDVNDVAYEMSIAGAAEFATKFPIGIPSAACGEGVYSSNNTPLFSWAGTSLSTNVLDPSDAILTTLSPLVGENQNDGLVGKCSSHFGKVLRDDYAQNHLDQVNQSNGLVNKSAEPKAIFRQHANRLKNMGL